MTRTKCGSANENNSTLLMFHDIILIHVPSRISLKLNLFFRITFPVMIPLTMMNTSHIWRKICWFVPWPFELPQHLLEIHSFFHFQKTNDQMFFLNLQEPRTALNSETQQRNLPVNTKLWLLINNSNKLIASLHINIIQRANNNREIITSSHHLKLSKPINWTKQTYF